jgi:hypothetical protein
MRPSEYDCAIGCGAREHEAVGSACTFESCCRSPGGAVGSRKTHFSTERGVALSIGCGYFTDDKRARQAAGVLPLAAAASSLTVGGRSRASVGKRPEWWNARGAKIFPDRPLGSPHPRENRCDGVRVCAPNSLGVVK